ncbi:MAG: hypothetical protein ACRD0K_28495 [Egibacteraceae bacterium]
MRFEFSFSGRYRAVSLLFGVTPRTAYVDVSDERILARFGPWSVCTPLANVAGTQITGPYWALKTIGPARLSLADRGLTFATNTRRGLCICFRDPVSGIEPTGCLHHPALTVTVSDIDGLAALFAARSVAS